MSVLTASEARANLYRLIDQVAESHDPVLIAGKLAIDPEAVMPPPEED